LDALSTAVLTRYNEEGVLSSPRPLFTPAMVAARNSPSTTLLYFASSKDGTLESSMPNIKTPEDARQTPWYAHAVTGHAHVRLIIDTRSLKRHTREARERFRARLVASAKSLIDTHRHNDLWIRLMSRTGVLERVLPCDDQRFSKEFIVSAVGNITVEEGVVDAAPAPLHEKKIWERALREAFHSIDVAFKKPPGKQNKVGAVVILSSMKNQHSGNLEHNLHATPVFGFHFPIETASTNSGNVSRQPQQCSNLGMVTNITSLSQAEHAGRFYEYLVLPIESVRAPTNGTATHGYEVVAQNPALMFWGGLLEQKNPMIWTLARPIYAAQTTAALPVLLGVAAVDANLRSIKELLNSVDNEIGRQSFPVLVTPNGETIFHPLQSLYKVQDLQDVGNDISNYEYFAPFDAHVREPLLTGETGSSGPWTIERALPQGDHGAQGSDATIIQTKYVYQPVSDFPLVILLVFDLLELERVVLNAPDPPPMPTCQVVNFDHGLNADITKNIKGFKIYNQNNCPHPSTPDVLYSNCKPDDYCDRTLRGQPLAAGAVAGAPPCVASSNCECEPHRWPVGTLMKGAATVQMSVVSSEISGVLYEESFEWTPSLSGDVSRFLQRDPNAKNPETLRLRPDSVSQALIAAQAMEIWTKDMWGSGTGRGIHNETVWIYLGQTTGSSFILPGNDFGTLWDATRRPWFLKAVSFASKAKTSKMQSLAVLSPPYIDAGGAGLISTLSAVVWGRYRSKDGAEHRLTDTILGVAGYDFLFETREVRNILKSTSNGACSTAQNVTCMVFDYSGMLIFYRDFMLSDAEKATIADQRRRHNVSREMWHTHNVFLGAKDPDLADALIAQGIFVLHTNIRSPDSKYLISQYMLDDARLSAALGNETDGVSVVSGLIAATGEAKCFDTPSEGSIIKTTPRWFLSRVEGGNSLLLVAEGYSRSPTCDEQTVAPPPISLDIQNEKEYCEMKMPFTAGVPSFRNLYNVCPRCGTGEYSHGLAPSFTSIQTERAASPSGPACSLCPSGWFTPTSGLLRCSVCAAGRSMTPGGEDCKACEHGRSSIEGETQCTLCPAGQFASKKSSLTAQQRLLESSFCEDCPAGWYQNRVGLQFCLPCPENTFGSERGSVSVALCQQCPSNRITTLRLGDQVDGGKNETDEEEEKNAKKKASNLPTPEEARKAGCFCQGTTKEGRAAAQNQYTGSQFIASKIEKYGSFCHSWDVESGTPYFSYCSELSLCGRDGNWCGASWCFVNDPAACRALGLDVAPTQVFSSASGHTETFYSYGVCGEPNCYDDMDAWDNGRCPTGLSEEQKAACIEEADEISSGTIAAEDTSNQGFFLESDCLCRKKLYFQEADSVQNGTLVRGVCRICPKGANCSARDGISLEEVFPEPGYFRWGIKETEFIDCSTAYRGLGDTGRQMAKDRCCPEGTCNGTVVVIVDGENVTTSRGTVSPCATGYTGPVCRACDLANDFVPWGSSCTHCEGGAHISASIGSMLVLSFVLFLVLVVIFIVVTPAKDDEEEEKRESVFNNLKIMFSWGQLFTSMPSSFGEVEWGSAVLAFASGIAAVVNLNVFGGIGFTSCALMIPYLDQFLVFMFTIPFLVFVVTPSANWVGRKIRKTLKKDSVHELERQAEISDKITTSIAQLIYPTVCTQVFSIFDCVQIGRNSAEMRLRNE
jgi:hypothetical protein